MVPLDYGLILIVLASALVGLVRGLFREVLSLATWLLGLWAAWRHADWLLPHVGRWIESPVLGLWAARLAVLVAVLLLGGLLAWLASFLLHRGHLAMPDRGAGMAFGMARGVLLAGIAVLVLRNAGFDAEPWWQESKLLPYAAPVADALQEVAEQEFGRSGQPSTPRLPPPAPDRAGS